MELRQYVTLARRYMWLVLLTTLLAGGTSYYVSRTMTPVYGATVTLQIDLANDPRNDITQSLMAGTQLSKTYVELIKSNKLIGQAMAELGLPGDAAGRCEDGRRGDGGGGARHAAHEGDGGERQPGCWPRTWPTQLADVFMAQNAAKQQARYDSGKQDLDRRSPTWRGASRRRSAPSCPWAIRPTPRTRTCRSSPAPS